MANSRLAFLARATPATEVATPGETSGAQAQVVAEVERFVGREVLSRSEALERGDRQALIGLLAQAAELGLTGLGVPERYGGLETDFTTAMRISAALARQESFSMALGAHLGVASLAVGLFGTDAQKERFLPSLVRAERIGAFALTEPGAGSDALSVTSRATLQGDGSYVLDGHKQFITNAGIAGLYTVFAKVDGESFTAFLLPAESPGLAAGPPERKMGLHGSVTASVTLDSVRAAADQVLGEVGGGHRIAFNILNLGRIRLGFSALGACREALGEAARYASERRQFGKPIGQLGLVRAKLAEMAARTWALDSVATRISGSLDAHLPSGTQGSSAAVVAALKAHSLESALVKVLGTETAAYVADEAVQIHGGYGYIEDYPVCRIYRDVRAKRIFEGTNEVNRLLLAGGLLKRLWGGELELAELIEGGKKPAPTGGPGSRALEELLRWTFWRLSGTAVEVVGAALEEEQLVLAGLADLVTELYAAETVRARAERSNGDPLHAALVELCGQAARRRAIGLVGELAGRLGLDPVELVSPLASGLRDFGAQRDCVASAVLERGGAV